MIPRLKSKLISRLKPGHVALFAITAFACSLAHAKNKKLQVPELFQTAHSVYVESIDGEINKPGLNKAEHDAILQVQEAIREWNRYTLAPSRDKADLVIVVRKGHNVGDQDHLGLGPHPAMPQPPALQPGQARTMQAHPTDQNASVGTGGDDIATQDLFRVYTLNEKGKLKGPVWARESDGGLEGPSVRLLMELKSAVEITYPRDAAPATETASQPTP
jgi:hypothetical protein